jgi:hypothetical protein
MTGDVLRRQGPLAGEIVNLISFLHVVRFLIGLLEIHQ